MSHHNQQQDLFNTNSAGIPLHCNVCPKKPDFSDVSHLLTHVASKGHLSNYYKLKIKATSDRAAQRATQEYDEWYELYNVQELMGERMKQKEKRKGSTGGGGGSGRRGSEVPSTSRNTPALPAYSYRRQGLRESTLDPQLGPRIKIEPESRSGTPVSALSVDPATLSRTFMPPMLQSWPTTPYGDSPMTREYSVFDSFDDELSSDYEDSESAKKSGPSRRARNLSDSNECSIFGEEELLQYDDGLKEGTRLKGVHWKGMGIFDAATLEMRRKRNQKKAYSVIQSLMATSEVVEPNEMVFSSDWELQREREITGNPNEDDDGGPLRGESSPEVDTPPPKKKPANRRSRPALVQKNVNNGRILRHRSSHHPGFNKGYSKGPYYDGQEDDDLTYGAPRPRKRSGLSIHRDNTGPEITFNNPSSMNTLTSGFRPRSRDSAAHDQGILPNGRHTLNNNYNHQRLPSLSAIGGTNSFRPANPAIFGNFGHSTGQSIFPNNQFNQNPFASVMGGAGALAAFQQHMGGMGLGQPQNPFGTDGKLHAQTQSLVQPQGA